LGSFCGVDGCIAWCFGGGLNRILNLVVLGGYLDEFRFGYEFAWLCPSWSIRVSIRGFEMLNRYPSIVLHGEASFYPSVMFSTFIFVRFQGPIRLSHRVAVVPYPFISFPF